MKCSCGAPVYVEDFGRGAECSKCGAHFSMMEAVQAGLETEVHPALRRRRYEEAVRLLNKANAEAREIEETKRIVLMEEFK